MLDFPNNPVTGDLFTAGGVSWGWDGTKWTSTMSAGGPFLPISGGTVGNTAMLVLVNNNAGVSYTKVSLGAPDSAGSGYRTLRVAN